MSDDRTIALYVHWPFCRVKCPYCDFNSHVRAEVDQGRWRRALLAELDHFAVEVGPRRLTSIFFGGGTPSLMPPATTAAVIDRAIQHFVADPALEITLEANPTSVEAGRFADYRTAGVNRASIGVQALDDRALKALGREHDAAEAIAAIELAGRTFPRWSFDLIYARPGQTVAAWRAELGRVLDLAGEHLSLYQLTIEPGTVFHARQRAGLLVTPRDDRQAALFELTQELTDAAGFGAYEVSNHARPGGECRHNLTYWRYEPYIGIGPGAFGRLPAGAGRVGTATLRAPEAWLRAVEGRGHGELQREVLAPEDLVVEALITGLRLTEGVPEARLAALDPDWRTRLDPRARVRLQEAEHLDSEAGALRLTGAGRLCLDAVLRELVAVPA
ncbi:MAG: radical SAM family heme chaperone HemW [Geminicoccaceae bacterium]|jgi:oxygen-independent coproporphyrinogen-3 oxidase